MSRSKNVLSKLIPQTLLARFLLIIIIPTLISQIVAVYLFYDRHWYNVSYYTGTMITNEVRLLLESFKKNDFDTQILLTKFLHLSPIFIADKTLSRERYTANEEIEILRGILSKKIVEKNIVSLKNDSKINIAIQLDNGVLEIDIPAKLLINPTTYIFILWLIFLTILLLSVSLIFSKNQIKSILELAKVADAFGRGVNININYKPTGAKEIRHAGIAFLKMKDRIEKQLTKRTQMLAMISHDLRTPLTRMKLQLALMENSQNIEYLNKDIESMNEMISSYLDFARGEGGEDFQVVEINDWLLQYLASEYTDKNIEFETKERLQVNIKPFAFQRVIVNLLSNAFKYGTKVKITIQSDKNKLLISVEDNGEGIKEEDRINVLKPFYRSDEARSLSSSGNVGLGLAITKEIVNDHKGDISLSKSQDLGGLLVLITLPIIAKIHKF